MLSPLSLHTLLQRVALPSRQIPLREPAACQPSQRPANDQGVAPWADAGPATLEFLGSPLMAALQLPKELAVSNAHELKALLQAWLDGLGKPEAALRLLASAQACGPEAAVEPKVLPDGMGSDLVSPSLPANLNCFHSLESQAARQTLWELLPEELRQLVQNHGTAALAGEWRRTFAFLQRLDPTADAELIAFLTGQGAPPALSEATLLRIAGQLSHPLKLDLSPQALFSFHAQIANSLPGPPLLQPLIEAPVPSSLLLSLLGGALPQRADFPRQWFAFMQRIDRSLFPTWAAYTGMGRLPPNSALAELPQALQCLADVSPTRLSFASIAAMEQRIAAWNPSFFQKLAAQFADPGLAETWHAWLALDPERQALFSFLDGLDAPGMATIRQVLIEAAPSVERLLRAWALLKDRPPVLDSWPFAPPDQAGMTRLMHLCIPGRSPILLPQRAELRLLVRALVEARGKADSGTSAMDEAPTQFHFLKRRWPQLDAGQRQQALRQVIATLPRADDLAFLETAAALLTDAPAEEADLQRLLRYARGQKQVPDHPMAWQDAKRAALLGLPEGGQDFYLELHRILEEHSRNQAGQALRAVLYKAELGQQIASALAHSSLIAPPESLLATLARGVGILLGKPIPFVKGEQTEAQAPRGAPSAGANVPAQAIEKKPHPGPGPSQNSPDPFAPLEMDSATHQFEQILPQQQLKLAHGWPLLLSLMLRGRDEDGVLQQMVWNLEKPSKGILWVAQFLFPRAGAVRLDVLAMARQRQATFWCERQETRARLAEGAAALRTRLLAGAGTWQLSFHQDGRRASCGPRQLCAQILRSSLDLRA